MRRLVHILVFLLVASIVMNGVLAGCRGWSSDRRLVEADTLIAQGDFDSALTQLRTIDTASLSTDDRAYHGLLVSQSAYKAYADSICLDTTWITRARQAYADGGPYDRHIRTLLYSGCIAKDLGDPITAMHWFKLTELEAKKDDHYHLGYALMNIGLLFQGEYNVNYAADRLKKALPHLEQTNCRDYSLYVLEQLAQMNLKDHPDSARHLIGRLEQEANETSSQQYVNISKELYVSVLFYEKNYQAVIDSALTLRKTDSVPVHKIWYYAAVSAAKTGQSALAHRFFDTRPSQITPTDSVFYYISLAELSKVDGNDEIYHKYKKISNELSDSTLIKTCNSMLTETEKSVELQVHKRTTIKYALYAGSVVVVLIICLTALLLRNITRRRKAKREIERLQEFVMQLEATTTNAGEQTIVLKDRIAQLQESVDQLEKDLSQKQSQLNHLKRQEATGVNINQTIVPLAEAFRSILSSIGHDSNSKEFKKSIRAVLTASYFRNIRQFVNLVHNGLVDHLADSEKLSDKDINVVCMHICRIPNSVIAVYTDTNAHSVTKIKKAIARKYFGNNDESLDTLINRGQ